MSSSSTEFIIMEDVVNDDTNNDAAFEVAVDDHDDTMDDENEFAASIALAKQLMAEEAMSSYANAMALLQQSDLSNEDFALVLQTMNEDHHHDVDHHHVDEEDAAANDGTTTTNNNNNNAGNNNGDHYETLLQLGDRIGNVKTERWRINAPHEIAKLSTMIYHRSSLSSSSSSSSDNTTSCAVDHHHHHHHVDDKDVAKCLVCQCDYDDGDVLRVLPCSHAFHQECVDPWLMDHDFCPSCRVPIVIDVDHPTNATTMSE